MPTLPSPIRAVKWADLKFRSFYSPGPAARRRPQGTVLSVPRAVRAANRRQRQQHLADQQGNDKRTKVAPPPSERPSKIPAQFQVPSLLLLMSHQSYFLERKEPVARAGFCYFLPIWVCYLSYNHLQVAFQGRNANSFLTGVFK